MAVTRHVNYFALQKACENPGCPICTIVNDRIHRYIDGMLFEHISDRTFRRQYRESGGFCKEHGKQLLTFRDGLAVAILTGGTLSDYLQAFRRKKVPKYKIICPACIERSRIEKEFLTFIAENDKKLFFSIKNRKKSLIEKQEQDISDEQMRNFFMASDGLCVPHYSMLLKLTKRVPKWLQDFQKNKFSSLLDMTNRFIDYSAWGKQKDFATLSQKEKLVWQEIAKTILG